MQPIHTYQKNITNYCHVDPFGYAQGELRGDISPASEQAFVLA